MELHLVADTNLFFECKALDQLSWQELGYDPVVILLTKPVLDEIDKHKKANGRTRSRALEIFSQVRGMLAASTDEVEIRASAPRVLLRRAIRVKPDEALKAELDYAKTDERLIGIVSTLSALAAATGYEVKLFTDDTGPAATADDLGVPYLMIDECWRRPASESTEAKKIKDLEKDLATYRAQEPTIVIDPCEGADDTNRLEVMRTIATPLLSAEVATLLEALRQKHPMKTDFTPPPPEISRSEKIDFAAPSAEAVADYQTQYPQWVDHCEALLRRLHEDRDVQAPPLVLRWSMSNSGTRPASKVRIEFEAKGSLSLKRLRQADDEHDENADDAPAASATQGTLRLPSPPRPPAFERTITPLPRPTVPALRTGVDLATLGALGELDRPGGTFHSMSAIAQAASASRLSGIASVDRFSSLMDAAGRSRFGSTFDQIGVGHLLRAGVLSTTVPRYDDLIPTFRPPRQFDPEAFYFDDWLEDLPVKKGALTCELWRHHTEPEIFEFEVLFEGDGEVVRGCVECTVHADNLTKPQQQRAIVCRTTTHLSLSDLATTMVEACG